MVFSDDDSGKDWRSEHGVLAGSPSGCSCDARVNTGRAKGMEASTAGKGFWMHCT